MGEELVTERYRIKPFSSLDNIDIKMLAGAVAMGITGAVTRTSEDSIYYSFGAYLSTFIVVDAGIRLYKHLRGQA